MSSERVIVAIDGPSGVGKSTVAEAVARRLGLPYLETGAMYRALGWQIHQAEVDPEDQPSVERVAAELNLRLGMTDDGDVEVLVEGRELDSRVRLPKVSEVTSLVSSYPAVRRRMVELQRQFAKSQGAVMEGRDIGSRVFPRTPHKFFLTAPLEVRVERRLRQLEQAGKTGMSLAQIEAEVAERDARDTQRRESPLTLDTSYTLIDTSELSVDEAVNLIVDRVEESTQPLTGDC
jgi:cytidylate kinase